MDVEFNGIEWIFVNLFIVIKAQKSISERYTLVLYGKDNLVKVYLELRTRDNFQTLIVLRAFNTL